MDQAPSTISTPSRPLASLCPADFAVAAILGIVAFLALAPFVVFPTEWDELVYMYVAWDATPAWFILNRYVHIYLQRAFMLLAGEAIPGAWLYWRFAIGCTVGSTYLLARLLSFGSHFATPIAAIAGFFSASMFFTDPGVTWVDTSCMMMLQFICIAGILVSRSSGRKRLAMVALYGFLLAMGLKTKETCICGAIYLLVFGGAPGEPFRWRQLGRDIGGLALGGLAGAILMTILDWSIISQPFYWIRPKTVKGFIGSVDLGFEFRRNAVSFPAMLANDSPMPILFGYLFFALAGLARRPDDAGWRLTAALPFGCVCFLSLLMGFTPIILLTPRYIFPVVPLMAVVAAAGACGIGFDAQPQAARRARPGWIGALLFVAALVPAHWLVRFVAESPAAHRAGYTWATLRMGAFVPIAVAALMGLAMAFARPRTWMVPLAGFLFWCAIVPGIRETAANFTTNSKLSKSIDRFYPFQAFRPRLAAMDEDDVLVYSASLHKQHEMLARDRNSLLWMNVIYFSRHAKWDNMHYVDFSKDPGPKNPDFVIMSLPEYEQLVSQDKAGEIARAYDIVREPRKLMVLMARRPNAAEPPSP